MRRQLLLLVTGLCALCTTVSAVQITIGTNAIQNGDAESGSGSATGNDLVSVPGWTTNGSFTVVQYMGSGSQFPTTGSPGPSSRGSNFFSGGPCSLGVFPTSCGTIASAATQTVDVSNISAQIDGGVVSFTLSGYLGGWTTQNDNAVLTAVFLDGSNVQIGSDSIGPVLAADRGSATSLLSVSNGGTIPVGTRKIEFDLVMTFTAGGYNDGYADNLSFVTTSGELPPTPGPSETPEPATFAMIGLGVAGLGLVRRLKR